MERRWQLDSPEDAKWNLDNCSNLVGAAMNLKEIRTWFVQESGRYDLIVDQTTWADKGADKYINAGQALLDRLQTTPKTMGRHFQVVEAGTYAITFTRCRVIKQVWVVPTVESVDYSRTKLTKKKLTWIRSEYPNMNNLTNGTPLYYAPAVIRAAPEPVDAGSLIDAPANYMDVTGDDTGVYSGILFMPPVDQQYMIEVWAYFEANRMSVDTDYSYWSVNYPELLVMASQAELELFSRNTEGAKDWMNAINLTCKGIDFDFVEEVIASVNQMEG